MSDPWKSPESRSPLRFSLETLERLGSGCMIGVVLAFHAGVIGGFTALGIWWMADPDLWFFWLLPVSVAVTVTAFGVPFTLWRTASRRMSGVQPLFGRAAAATGFAPKPVRWYHPARTPHLVGERAGHRVVVRFIEAAGPIVGVIGKERAQIFVEAPVPARISRIWHEDAPPRFAHTGLEPVGVPLPGRSGVSAEPETLAKLLADPEVLALVDALTAGRTDWIEPSAIGVWWHTSEEPTVEKIDAAIAGSVALAQAMRRVS
jgi:hypothetical protein